MKTLLTSIFIAMSVNLLSQTKTDKIIITSIGASATVYGFTRKDITDLDKKANTVICLSGVLFAAIPYIFDKPKRFEFTSSGINIKLKYKKYKCKFDPYKKRRYLQ